MGAIEYVLGSTADIETLYPAAKYANEDVGVKTYADVVAHYTSNSLKADAIPFSSVTAESNGDQYVVKIESSADQSQLDEFAKRHTTLFGPTAGAKAINGMKLMKELEVWNPMSGYPVNFDSSDGKCKWSLFPPLGLNVIGQRGLLLLHYPPWQVLQQGTFLEVMTMHRWNRVLLASGVPEDEVNFYRTFIDINPIAAPGSGQSEYPNDFFPIMMASAFFHGPSDSGRDYIQSMLELYLNPPGAEECKYTLPLLICGSPLYDPQAPGWFRATYKDILPKDAAGSPEVKVMQYGTFKVRPDSKKETPYLIGNHMIAAGVTGKCTDHPDKIPDIRKYEAQDLVAADFLHQYAKNPDISPKDAAEAACLRWFGNKDGSGAPEPKNPDDKNIICALAQMDLFFEPGPPPHPKYNWEEAVKRCTDANNGSNPCCGSIEPSDLSEE